MTKFYTKTGDDGYTGLLGKGRVPKYDRRIELIGSLDEANAALGVARSFSKSPLTGEILVVVQRNLYSIMAEVSATPENAQKFQKIESSHVQWIEAKIDEISHIVAIPAGFIVPGDSKPGALLDLARAIVRRAERQLVRLIHTKKVENRELLHYLNRLSSLCFILELLENQELSDKPFTMAKE